MMWELDQALSLTRVLNQLLNTKGWHVALAGGVLNKGSSEHDLDLVFYPHSTTNVNLIKLRDALYALGWIRTHSSDLMINHWITKGSTDRKFVEVYQTPDGRRVDVIIPSLYG